MASMVRIDEQTHALLKRSASKEGVSMQELLKRALEEYRRHRILEQANVAYAAVRENAEEYKAWREEQSELEGVALDGLDEADAIERSKGRPLSKPTSRKDAHPHRTRNAR